MPELLRLYASHILVRRALMCCASLFSCLCTSSIVCARLYAQAAVCVRLHTLHKPEVELYRRGLELPVNLCDPLLWGKATTLRVLATSA